MSVATNGRMSWRAWGRAGGRSTYSQDFVPGCPPAERLVRPGGAAGGRAFLCLVEACFLAVFLSVRLLSRFVPPEMLNRWFDLLGSAILRSFPGIRNRLLEKISEAMPELAGKEAERIAHGACCALLMPMLDVFLLERYPDRFLSELVVEGAEHLESADSMGRGVILAACHLGRNSLRISVMARIGRPYTPIYYHPDDSPVSRYYRAMLARGYRLGCDPQQPVFWAGRNTKERVREHLLDGKRVGIDLDVAGGCVVEFFGRPAAMADGIAHFALQTGAPIVPFALTRGPAPLASRLVFYQPIVVEPGGDYHQEVRSVMSLVAAAGERMIRDAPEQWESWFGVRHFWEKAAEPRAAVYAPRLMDR